jgi:phenylpropionate dioxygenase-like ring-hydroxylating dioxygenase large terminal subunit
MAETSHEPGLPVRWYLDPDVWDAERELLFDLGPRYVAHRLAVPRTGDHSISPVAGEGWALVNDSGRVRLVSNVCRHRQATILTGCGRSRSLVCPLHRWSYGLDGRLRGAPGFAERPALDLEAVALQDWHGLLFTGPRDVAADLAPLSLEEVVRTEGYVRQRVEVERYEANWKTFVEVYLEDYHVVPFHPGLRGFSDCDELRWTFAPWGSVQWVGVVDDLERAGSPAYERWHERIRRHGDPRALAHAAVWATYFPNVTVEWYPHTLVVSTVVPDGPGAFTNVIEYLYPADLLADDPGFADAQQAAYAETAVEDRVIIERMHAGRRALAADGRDERGPYQRPLEDGLVHFHDFLWDVLGPIVAKPSETG